MIKINCKNCKKEFNISPSRLGKKFFCSIDCYKPHRIKQLEESGKSTRYDTGHKPHPNQIKSLKEQVGKKHWAWKGDSVSYRGLHYWIIRHKGKAGICTKCNSNKNVQWANIDGKYNRNLNEYIELCASCHKKYDINMKKNY